MAEKRDEQEGRDTAEQQYGDGHAAEFVAPVLATEG
jgi:hypothetical protein